MAVPIPRNALLLPLYHLLPVLAQVLFLYSAYNYKIQELVDRLQSQEPGSNQGGLEDDFDFIIVGGGTTGSILANRLSADPANKVLLLEAGGEPSFPTRIPVMFPISLGNVAEDWKYETVPQKNAAFGLIDNVVRLPAGKGLGGSSVIGGLMFVRGKVQGFDLVANLTDDPIWRMENVLRYYKAIEDYHGFHPSTDAHGSDGPASITKPHLSPYVYRFESALHEAGYDTVDQNPNGPMREGFGFMENFMKKGRRWSTYDGYIKPLQGTRSNLVIHKFSQVYRVLFADDAENTAIGVEYIRHRTVHKAFAKKEIILSAGAIGSPKVLMLSGVGPRHQLESLGILPRVDLPVGENLLDRYGVHIGPFQLNAGTGSAAQEILSTSTFAQWFAFGTGQAATTFVDAMYNVRLNESKSKIEADLSIGAPTPDFYGFLENSPGGQSLGEIAFRSSFNFDQELISYFHPSEAGSGEAFFQFIVLATPHGHGTLRLRDTNPINPPLIDPNYFGDARDLHIVVEGVKFAVKLVEESNALKRVGAKISTLPLPSCKSVPFRSDAYWECFVKQAVASGFKYGNTAPLGQTPDDGVSVVDPRLRVFGTRRLRVVDASVLSDKYVSVSQATCMMLGELASDFILEDNLSR